MNKTKYAVPCDRKSLRDQTDKNANNLINQLTVNSKK